MGLGYYALRGILGPKPFFTLLPDKRGNRPGTVVEGSRSDPAGVSGCSEMLAIRKKRIDFTLKICHTAVLEHIRFQESKGLSGIRETTSLCHSSVGDLRPLALKKHVVRTVRKS